MNRPRLIGAIEAGGTKTVCAVGSSWQEVAESEKLFLATETPEVTMRLALDFFLERSRGRRFDAIGVGTFGPVDLATTRISLSTPKVAWRGADWADAITARFGEIAIAFDTDVNAAGLAEWRWGASRNCEVSVYWTIGTGIGGALVVNGRPIHGLQHPEFGHMFVPRVAGDEFVGTCLSHGDCLEGLAAGVAIAQRWGVEGSRLPFDHPAWDLEARYLASAVANVIALSSPQSIVLGGGVMSAPGLLDKVRKQTRELLNGYFSAREVNEGVADFLVAPALGSNAGVIGAFALANDALDGRR